MRNINLHVSLTYDIYNTGERETTYNRRRVHRQTGPKHEVFGRNAYDASLQMYHNFYLFYL